MHPDDPDVLYAAAYQRLRRARPPLGRFIVCSGTFTHPPPPTEDEESGVVEPDTILPELEYPLKPKGPFVRPGTYAVAIHAAQRADSLHERLQTLAEDRDASDELSALVDTAETRTDELGDLRGEIYGAGRRLQLERRHAAVAAAAHADASTALRAAPRAALGRNHDLKALADDAQSVLD